MTQDEIIEMTRQAGGFDATPEFLERFAHLVAAKATEEANARANALWELMCKKMVAFEREACAMLCENMAIEWEDQPQFAQVEIATMMDCALAIRARGDQA